MGKMQSSQFKISGLLQLTFLGSKTTQPWRPILDLNKPNLSETIRTSLQQVEWVTSIDFKDAYFHLPEYTGTIQEIPEISHPRSGIPVQGSAIRFAHSTHGVHCDTKGGETDGYTQGFKSPPVPRLVGESQIPPGLSPTYTGTSKLCQQLGWLVNLEKSELEPKQDFDFVGYRVRLTPDQWQNLQQEILNCYPYRLARSRNSSLDRFANSYRKQVHLGLIGLDN